MLAKLLDQLVLPNFFGQVRDIQVNLRYLCPPVDEDISLALAGVLLFPFSAGQVGFAGRFAERADIEERPQPRPQHDDDDVALGRRSGETVYCTLWAQTRRHGCLRCRIIPAHDLEGDSTSDKRIIGQLLGQQAMHGSTLVGHIARRSEKDAKVLLRCWLRHQLPSTIRFFQITTPTP